MSSQVDVDPSLTIIAQGVTPFPPTVLRIGQVGPNVKVVIQAPSLTTVYAVTELKLYRGPSPSGPWSLVDYRQISDISLQNNLFDTAPNFGVQQYYCATALDYNFNESAKTPAIPYAASQATANAATSS